MAFDVNAAKKLKASRSKLTKQQYRTLKGQILAGDSEGAMKGLKKILQSYRQWKQTMQDAENEK